jgi:hypothetical protein
MAQTKKQKQEKALEYWKKELEKGAKRISIMGRLGSTIYIQGQIKILTEKLGKEN